MRKIVIANQKGGVGKTTTAVNIAAGLSRAGRKTLLVDMDPQANATFAVMGPQQFENTIYDVVINNLPTYEAIVSTPQDNLYLLPSTIDLAGAEVELVSKVGGQTRLRNKLKDLEGNGYDFLIIDAPPSLGFLTINALAAASEVLIPVSTSIFALNGIQMLESTIEQVRVELNVSELYVSGVLVTFHDHTNVARDVFNEVKGYFTDKVFSTVIPKNVKLEEAHSRTESIFVYDPSSRGAEAYAQLVQEVMNRG